jgi:spermidine/putrescine transport system ATP-binding protein
LRFEGVSKRFGDVVAVDGVTLEVEEGAFFALLGPSGCGKTTLLRLLAGFETPSEGRIFIDGSDVSRTPPHRRPVNMVFQSYAVFPHMSVDQNVGYGLKVEGVAKAERRRRVAEALALVKLEGYGARRPDQLSGGQRQRVALARALVKRPRILLLDEPLSALDAKLREVMRFELTQLQETLGVTFIMVTHDQEEALAMAGRCAVMDRGRLQQVASPADLYDRPASRFVADFIGSVNLLEGVVERRQGEGLRIRCAELSHPVDVAVTARASIGERVWIALRPERIVVARRTPDDPPPEDQSNGARGVVRHLAYLGSQTVYDIEIEGGRRLRASRTNSDASAGDRLTGEEAVWLSWSDHATVVLTS